MATVINHQFLFSTDLKYFKDKQIVGGKEIIDRYQLAGSMLEKLEEEYQDFLAYPVKDGDYIEFYGIKPKQDIPQILSELQGDNATKYQDIKTKTLVYYKNKIEEFKATNKDKAEFLEKALKFIDDRFVFCYDDKVVLGAWGMQVRENVREDITVIRKSSPRKDKKYKEQDIGINSEPEIVAPIIKFNVSFISGENGTLSGNASITKDANSYINDNEIPHVDPREGYEFVGWSENPNGYQVASDNEFFAQYQQLPPEEIIPWWKRFWLWLTALFAGRGCLRWLWRALLFLLLLLLLIWMLRGCHGCNHHIGGGAALGDNDSTWLREEPAHGKDGGIYDPFNPYDPKPTPPGYEDVLPPKQGGVTSNPG
ncbi:MAG: hypothetical protein IPL20_00060 [Saprospiraceae bacterium]|nr:hypothetical protein [Saprospiraceae bacterium]